MLDLMEAVRRPSDGELCGYVEQGDGRWHSLTVFGAVLGSHDQRPSAAAPVLSEGLSSLAERWSLRHGESGDEEVVRIQEANDGAVTVARATTPCGEYRPRRSRGTSSPRASGSCIARA